MMMTTITTTNIGQALLFYVISKDKCGNEHAKLNNKEIPLKILSNFNQFELSDKRKVPDHLANKLNAFASLF